jgi:alpha-L-rhamnosidase
MRKYWLPVLVLFLLSKADNLLSDSPTGLMVEFIRDPVNVPLMDLCPEFSWIVPAEAKYQTAYQVLIATSAEKRGMDITDILDSHKVQSYRSSKPELL